MGAPARFPENRNVLLVTREVTSENRELKMGAPAKFPGNLSTGARTPARLSKNREVLLLAPAASRENRESMPVASAGHQAAA